MPLLHKHRKSSAHTTNAFISIPKTTFSKLKVWTSLTRRKALWNCEFDVTKYSGLFSITCESSISYLYSSGRRPRSLGDIDRHKILQCWCTGRWGRIHLFRRLYTRQYLHRDWKLSAVNLHRFKYLLIFIFKVKNNNNNNNIRRIPDVSATLPVQFTPSPW